MAYLLYNGRTVTSEGIRDEAVVISGERIEAIIPNGDISPDSYAGFRKIDLEGKLIFAGGIDAHVHFREPGLTHKADIGSESLAAAAGGVTSFIDMPNTSPATTSAKALSDKLHAAENRSFANYGFHIGATNDNFQEIEEILSTGKEGIGRKDFAGIKVFMGSSTGNMLVNDETSLDRLFSIKDKEILVHCEDEMTIKANLEKARAVFGDDIPFAEHSRIRSREACILSSGKALSKAVKYGTRLHLLHISTAEEIRMAEKARMLNPAITTETSANYLWFSDSDYAGKGSRIKCNPSVKTAGDRKALREALKGKLIDTIGSDHAPHLPEEKDRKYPEAPSGMPSVQQTLQVLLTVAMEENIPLSVIASAFSEKAAEIFGIKERGKLKAGNYADIAIVDPEARITVDRNTSLYKCGWSPYEGAELRGRITDVFVNGVHVIKALLPTGCPAAGKKIVFEK